MIMTIPVPNISTKNLNTRKNIIPPNIRPNRDIKNWHIPGSTIIVKPIISTTIAQNNILDTYPRQRPLNAPANAIIIIIVHILSPSFCSP